MIAAMPATAMVLAAGTGTRLRPLTSAVPKCMVVVAGKPILEHVVLHLRAHGVRKIIMNLHHLPETIIDHFGDGRAFGVSITYSMEPVLLGTAGAVVKMREYFTSPFFVWYGDNLSACKLDRLFEFHRIRRGMATIAVFQREDPTSSGIVDLDADDQIRRFVEKPAANQVFSNWVNAGIYLLDPEALDFVPRDRPSDFGRDVFPALLKSGKALHGYRMSAKEGLWWVDTPADLDRVQKVFQSQMK